MLKIIGLTIIFLSCCMIGFCKGAAAKKRSVYLKTLLNGISGFCHLVRDSKTETAEILEKCFPDGCVFLQNGKIDFNRENLLAEDTTFLNEFFGGFGALGSEDEEKRCETYIKAFGKKVASAREESGKLFKLYNTLGVLSGLFFCIFLL